MELKTFFDNFETMAEAPNGVQKLREMILQLAVQGKLVPQDPNDEPASVLLKKVRVDQPVLAMRPIEDHETPYKAPPGWSWLRIGALLVFQYGKALPKAGKAISGTVPVYGANGIKKYSNVALVNSPVIIVGRKGSAGAVNKVHEPCWPLDVTYYIQPSLRLDFDFVFLLLKSMSLEKLAKGIKPGLNRNEAYDLPICLPPEAEQHRIVAKVDELMALCDDLEARKQKTRQTCIQLNDACIDKMLAAREPARFNKHWQRILTNFDLLYSQPENVNKLRQAILQLAVQGKLVPQDPNDEPASSLITKLNSEKKRLVKEGVLRQSKPLPAIQPEEWRFKVPNGWTWEKIDRICFVTKLAGFEYTKYIEIKDQGEVPVIRAQNVRMGRLNDTNLKYIDMRTSELLVRSALSKPSLLMTFIGAGIGDVAIFDKSYRWHLAPNVAKLEPYIDQKEKALIKYLLIYLMSDTGKAEIFKHRKATAQPSLSMATIRDINVSLPPTNEQRRIVLKVQMLLAQCDDLETKLQKSQKRNDRLMEAAVAEMLAA